MLRGIKVIALAVCMAVVGAEQVCKIPDTYCPRTFCVDLSNGRPERFPSGMGLSWDKDRKGTDPYIRVGQCADQGRIKIQPPCWAKALRIDETSIGSEDWTFNLGDEYTNNGWGGNSGGPNHWSAEAQILNGVFNVYKNHQGDCRSQQYTDFATTLGAPHSMSLTVSKFGLERQSYLGAPSNYIRRCDKCLFNWETMYLGMNRVVDGTYRTGRGLCTVCFTWETCNFCDRHIEPHPHDVAKPVEGVSEG